MDEDFGFMESRAGGLKNEDGKSTNGGVSSDQLDQSLRTLSVSQSEDSASALKTKSAAAATAEENNNQRENHNNNNNNNKENGDKMLKHTKKSVITSVPGSTPVNNNVATSQSTTTPTTTPALQKSSSNGNPLKNSATSPPPESTDQNQVTLPQRFVVKYLGYRETSNLWGIKYTRRPVDEMVKEAKEMLSQNGTGSGVKSLPLLKLEVTDSGISVGAMPQNNNPDFPSGKFVIEAISYGVQDLVYTRVFAMIVVKSALAKEGQQGSQAIRLADIQKATSAGGGGGGDSDSMPFRCHAFVCDSRQTARKLTYSLATAFHKFSHSVAAGKVALQKPKKFAIDLRSSEEIEADLLDSEA